MASFLSTEYGGAAAAAVHQNRLVLFGSKVMPDLLIAASTLDHMDFSLVSQGTGEESPTAKPTDGFWIGEVSAFHNTTHAVAQQEGLFLFGSDGESVIHPGPFASDVHVRENTQFGSDPGSRPVIIDGVLCFVQKDGQDIRGIQWTEQQAKYEAPSLREFAGPVFERAVGIAAQESTDKENSTLYVIDSTGGVATGSFRRTLPNVAWTTWTTGGKYRIVRGRPAALEEEVAPDKILSAEEFDGNPVFLVERNGNICLEELEDREDRKEGDPLLDVYTAYTSENPPEKPIKFKEGQVVWARTEILNRGVVNSTWQRYDWIEELSLRYNPAEGEGWEFVFGDMAMAEPSVPDVKPFSTAVEIRIGKPYSTTIETVPIAIRTSSGSRISALSSNIFGLVCTYEGGVPTHAMINLRRRASKQARTLPAEKLVSAARYGGITGWRRRSTIRLDYDTHCTIVSIGYRTSG